MWKKMQKQAKKAVGGIEKNGFGGAVVKEAAVIANNAEKQAKKAADGIEKNGLDGAVVKQFGQWVEPAKQQEASKQELQGPQLAEAKKQSAELAKQEVKKAEYEARAEYLAQQQAIQDVADAVRNEKIEELFNSKLELVQSHGINLLPEQQVELRNIAEKEVLKGEAEEAVARAEAQKEEAIQEDVLARIEVMKSIGIEPTVEQEIQFRKLAIEELFGSIAPDEEEYKHQEVELGGGEYPE